MVPRLIEPGASIHGTMDQGKTTLLRTAVEGVPDVMHLLLDEGARIDATSNLG